MKVGLDEDLSRVLRGKKVGSRKVEKERVWKYVYSFSLESSTSALYSC
jgi:hypothetical protein